MSHARVLWYSLTLLAPWVGCGTDTQDQPQEMSEMSWPRKFEKDGVQVTVFDPQIESWEVHERLKARSAIAVSDSAAREDRYGVIEYEVETEVDFETRQVLLKNRTIKAVRIQGGGKEAAARLEETVRRVLDTHPSLRLSLDFVLAYVEKSHRAVPSVPVNLEPPPILASEVPAILVIFLGEPEFKPVQGTGLQFATNTNWDVLLDSANRRYYLLHGEGWLTTADRLEGPWEATVSLPADLSNLPRDENWSETRKFIPGKKIAAPRVFVVVEPSELIVIDGRPTFAPIAGTRLAVVTNTTSDLFRHEGESNWYFLTSGRWFRAKSLKGPWTAATTDLPEDFAKIPDDHPKAEVLACSIHTRR